MASSSLKHLLRALIAQHAASLAVRSWRSASLGSLSSLRLETTPQEPLTEPDQVRVEVRAVGLNFADIFSVLGLYKAANEVLAGQRDRAEAFCPGLEFAGVVTECGPAATSSVQVGERVFGFARFGAFRSEVVARAPLVRKIPSDWSFEEGASLLVQGLTAWHGLVELGGAERGGRALVHAAAGGVGLHTLQICDALGLASTAVVSGGVDGEKASLVRARHPTARVVARARTCDPRAYAAQLREALGGGAAGYDVVMDSLGGRWFDCALDALAPMGRIVHFGATSSYGSAASGVRKWLSLIPAYLARPRVDPGVLTSTNRGVLGFNLIFLTEREELLAAEARRDYTITSHARYPTFTPLALFPFPFPLPLSQLDAMCTRGGLLERPPVIGRTFSFEELPAALGYLQSGASVGKVVVRV